MLTAAVLTDQLGMADNTAQRALAQLTDAGILAEQTGARRNRVWQDADILDVLDLYAQAIRRS